MNGSISPLVSALIAYTISGGSWDDLPAGDYIITATLTSGALELAEAAGWVVSGSTATRTVHVDAPATCVTPSVQSSTQTCVPNQPDDSAAGAITVGTEPGVSYVVRDSDDEVIMPRHRCRPGPTPSQPPRCRATRLSMATASSMVCGR